MQIYRDGNCESSKSSDCERRGKAHPPSRKVCKCKQTLNHDDEDAHTENHTFRENLIIFDTASEGSRIIHLADHGEQEYCANRELRDEKKFGHDWPPFTEIPAFAILCRATPRRRSP